MQRRRVVAVLAAGVLGLALAGCGGDDTEEALEEAATQAETVIDEAATQAESVIEEAEDAVTGAIDTVTGEAADVIEDVQTVELAEQNGSGQSGTATLTANDDGTVHVSIELSGSTDEPQPAHIHEGTCADLNPEPAFGLADVLAGTSETDVDVGLDDLALSDYAVNVHESAANAEVYVACGDITSLDG
jgi:hypothetical protein